MYRTRARRMYVPTVSLLDGSYEINPSRRTTVAKGVENTAVIPLAEAVKIIPRAGQVKQASTVYG